jgi:hypothetical protein
MFKVGIIIRNYETALYKEKINKNIRTPHKERIKMH